MAGSVAIKKDKKTASKQDNIIYKKILRQMLIYVISLAIVIGTLFGVANTLYERYFLPVDINDTSRVEVVVPMGTSVSGIAQILHDQGLIPNVGVFKLLVDLSNKSNRMKAGKYRLSKSMTMQEMIDELLTGKVAVNAVSITIREGEDIRTMAKRLVNEYKLPFVEEDFIKAAKNINTFLSEFYFLEEIPEERHEMDFPMEGYLFPNTYYVYADDTPNNIIRVMLREFDKIYTEEMREKAREYGMSIDEVVTLASIIQNEGRDQEFEKISAVFHNRMNINMKLESCATVNYFLDKEVNQTNLTNEDINTPHQWNTYLNDGLPVGPISSPGRAAIMAALHPYEEYMTDDNKVLFFLLMDPRDGLHAFNTTYQGHVNDKKKYEHLWTQQ